MLKEGGRGNTAGASTSSRAASWSFRSSSRSSCLSDRYFNAVDPSTSRRSTTATTRRHHVRAHGLMDGDYPNQDARKLFYDRMVRELAANSEFSAVALTNRFRMIFSGNGPIEIEGKSTWTRRSSAGEQRAGHGRVLRRHGPETDLGRTFKDDDLDAKLPVAVVNMALRAQHYGNDSALGRRFRTVGNNGTSSVHGAHRRRGLHRAHARTVQQSRRGRLGFYVRSIPASLVRRSRRRSSASSRR